MKRGIKFFAVVAVVILASCETFQLPNGQKVPVRDLDKIGRYQNGRTSTLADSGFTASQGAVNNAVANGKTSPVALWGIAAQRAADRGGLGMWGGGGGNEVFYRMAQFQNHATLHYQAYLVGTVCPVCGGTTR